MSQSSDPRIAELTRLAAAKAAEVRALADQRNWAQLRCASHEAEQLEAQLAAARSEATPTNVIGRVRVDG